MTLDQVATPALLLDLPKLRRNCDRMLAKARSLGTTLRPHMKTLKSADAARLATDPEHGGIAVSTLREAEYFVAAGFSDIQLAVCITPDKLARAAALVRMAPRFSFFVDSISTAAAVSAFARAQDVRFRVWIEIDSGEHRTGVAADDPALIEIARALGGSPAVLAGIATHGGHSYATRNAEAAAAIAEEERIAVTSAADRLRAAGFVVEGVSAGSTPTATHARSAAGITELRPGVYMAGDLFQAGVGSLPTGDIAVSVLASVISRGPDRILLDAGGLALSKDRSTAGLAEGNMGYGLVVDAAGSPSFGPLTIAGVHQEHGEIRITDPRLPERLPIGSRVRILPNHACMTTAMYDRYLLVEDDRVVGEWDKCGGW
jgi:D-serine deaminase-like pyridoxal phosphate-dependent protein